MSVDPHDTDVERAARERASFRAQIEEGLALRRRLAEEGGPPIWPERLRARVSRRLVPLSDKAGPTDAGA